MLRLNHFNNNNKKITTIESLSLISKQVAHSLNKLGNKTYKRKGDIRVLRESVLLDLTKEINID